MQTKGCCRFARYQTSQWDGVSVIHMMGPLRVNHVGCSTLRIIPGTFNPRGFQSCMVVASVHKIVPRIPTVTCHAVVRFWYRGGRRDLALELSDRLVKSLERTDDRRRTAEALAIYTETCQDGPESAEPSRQVGGYHLFPSQEIPPREKRGQNTEFVSK